VVPAKTQALPTSEQIVSALPKPFCSVSTGVSPGSASPAVARALVHTMTNSVPPGTACVAGTDTLSSWPPRVIRSPDWASRAARSGL